MRAALWASCCTVAVAAAAGSWSLHRLPNRADGGPAFAIVSPEGRTVARISCTYNQWVDTEELSTRIMSSRELMSNIVARQGKLSIDELGPGKYDCVLE